ncbi:hypothetical protein JKY72_04000 [Candidatus Gracilibacteria bacterium]|nr:hypothetical protein [Candidatus Gracilibacteria bacterium]
MNSSNKHDEDKLPQTGNWDFDIDKLNKDAAKIRELDKKEDQFAYTKK